MKKISLFISALAGLFLAASCQRENLEPVGSGVTYEITLPTSMQTKGASGYDEYDLYCHVYKTIDADALSEVPLLFKKQVEMQGNKAIVSFDLLNDQDYTILFWANKKDADCYNLEDLRNVAIKGTVASNDDERDAFCGKDQIEAHDVALSRTVTLKRPFAQLNIATLVPFVGYDITPESSLVKLTNVPVAYNVFEGKAAGEEVEFTYGDSEVPAGTLTVNGTEYVKAAMNYLFVPESNIDVYYEITTASGVVKNTIPNVPVKQNYRTNIIGNLLTSTATYDVQLLPGFEDEQYYGPEFVKEPAYDSETGTYTVVDLYELKWIAQQVNSGKNDFKDKTVQLAADIDLNNEPWTPIGLSTEVSFKGTFEGVTMTKAANDYPTIRNLYIENGNCAGFFKVLCNGGKIRNVNFDGAKISGERQLGVVAGNVYGNLDIPVVENVTVENIQITAVPVWDGEYHDNGDKVGAIAGLVGQEAFLKGNTVKNAVFKAYRDMGGIVGSTQENEKWKSKFADNTVENLTFIITPSYEDTYKPDKNGVAPEPGSYHAVRGGTRGTADEFENNEGEEIELHKVYEESSDGMVSDEENREFIVTSPTGLAEALNQAGMAGAGDHTITIIGDLDMTGVEWTPIKVDGYHGADIVTLEGNGATIKGLTGALFAGGFAGGSGIVIKDLTIEGAYMIADNTQGYGAFVNCADSMDEITLINCHLKNSTIITPDDGTVESRIGGLVGWTAGYNNQNDGPVDSYITIKNCSVTGCTIKGAGSIGGICGHAGANAATFTTIEDCTVTGNTLISTDNGDWRVGAVVGTANNGQCVIKNITSSGNTCSQIGKTAPVWHTDLYGRFVPSGTGTLTIDGVEISDLQPTLVEGYTALYTDKDGNYVIYDKAGLADLNAYFDKNWNGNDTWNHEYHIGADIDAEGFTWESVYLNVGSNDNNGLVLDGKGHTISNMAISESMFTGTPNGGNETTPGYVKNITIDNAIVTGGHWNAVFWGTSWGELVYENVAVKNTSVTGACNVAIFLGGTALENPAAESVDEVIFKNCSVENCTLIANGKDGQDPNGASVFCGRAFANTTLKFEGTNSIDDATTITNKNGLVGGKVYGYTTWVDGGFMGTGACDTFTNWAGISSVSDGASLVEAVKAGKNVVLTDNITMTETCFSKYVNIEGNGHTISQDQSCTNTYALFDVTNGAVSISNVKFENVKGGAVVRTVDSECNIDNISVENSEITQTQGLLRLLGKSTITNSTFKNNTCNMLISLNYDGDNNDSQVVRNCVFEKNTCKDVAVVYYVKGAGAEIDSNKFIKNNVTASAANGNGATVYMGFTENNVITNNVFRENEVTTSTKSKRCAGALMLGYKTVVTGNAFIDNKATATDGHILGNDVCASVFYTDIDLSGNYWGGGAPVENDNYFIEYPDKNRVIIYDYLTTYVE